MIAKIHALSYDLAPVTARVVVVLLNAISWLLTLQLTNGAKYHQTPPIAATSARRTLRWLVYVCQHMSNTLTTVLVLEPHALQRI
ncbi:MAG: hypothetical protein ACKPKO_45905 [Candidatus Fonsibacter sp.]